MGYSHSGSGGIDLQGSTAACVCHVLGIKLKKSDGYTRHG